MARSFSGGCLYSKALIASETSPGLYEYSQWGVEERDWDWGSGHLNQTKLLPMSKAMYKVEI